MNVRDYHANLAVKPVGQRLTVYFLPSSSNSTPNPNVAGRKKCSTGTRDVLRTTWSSGIYVQKIAMHSAKAIDGKRSKFCVTRLKTGGCWKMLSRRVRIARSVNHCLRKETLECSSFVLDLLCLR